MMRQRLTGSYLVDHVQSALKDGIKDLGYLAGDVPPQLVDNSCHGAEDFRLTGGRDIALVVNEDGIQQGGNKVLTNLKQQQQQQEASAKKALSDAQKPEQTCFK